MIMKKKVNIIFISLMLIQLIIPLNNFNAKELDEIYYINDNNVELTKDEYDFLSKFYWEGYQDNMTTEDYKEFIDSDLLNGKYNSVENVYYDNSGIMLYDASHKTNSKLIKISSSCKDTCTISVVVTWSSIPNTKSYDLIGAYLDGVKLKSTPKTTAQSSIKKNESQEMRKLTNGFGVSILIPTEGTGYIISQTFKVSKGGTIYASYQHAKRNISLADSRKYSISRAGYGGVFKFTGTAIDVYDQMGGVYLKV